MNLLVISPSEVVADEARPVSEMRAAGLHRLHIRKPHFSRTEMAALLAQIPTVCRPRLVRHSHHGLVAEIGWGATCPPPTAPWIRAAPPLRPGQPVSTAVHPLTEARQHRRHDDYVFLSRIFDSLSKRDYPAACSPKVTMELLSALRLRAAHVPRVVALGGINSDHLATVEQAGFAGAAMVGTVWQSPDPVAAFCHR